VSFNAPPRMKFFPIFGFCAVLFFIVSPHVLQATDWLQFRGSGGRGVSEEQGLPKSLSESEIAWKSPLPGRGISSPLVIGDRLYLTASSGPEQDRLHVICLKASDGSKIWERQFWATGRTMTHAKICVATSTPCSDGQRIYAAFSSNDMLCLDLEGGLIWMRGLTRDYPNASNSLGMASSPIVVDETVVFSVESDSESFAIGLSVRDGSNRWKIARPKQSNWTSPVALGGDIALLSAAGLSVVEASSGKQKWAFGGGSSMSSVTLSDGMVYVPTKGTTALRPPNGAGEPEVVWQNNQALCSTVSPVVHNGRLYTVNNAGILRCSSAKDGEKVWQLRTTGPYSATPVAAGDNLYMVNEKGLVQSIDTTAPEGAVVSSLDLQDTFLGTPSIGPKALYLRSDKYLYRLGTGVAK
jgi:outer membrane protein assembly factor BamB